MVCTVKDRLKIDLDIKKKYLIRDIYDRVESGIIRNAIKNQLDYRIGTYICVSDLLEVAKVYEDKYIKTKNIRYIQCVKTWLKKIEYFVFKIKNKEIK
jgi:hypothetical protein